MDVGQGGIALALYDHRGSYALNPNDIRGPLNDLIGITRYGVRRPDRVDADRVIRQRISGDKPRLARPGSRQDIDHSALEDVIAERG